MMTPRGTKDVILPNPSITTVASGDYLYAHLNTPIGYYSREVYKFRCALSDIPVRNGLSRVLSVAKQWKEKVPGYPRYNDVVLNTQLPIFVKFTDRVRFHPNDRTVELDEPKHGTTRKDSNRAIYPCPMCT